MHELGLAEGLLAVTLDIAGARPVQRVQVRVGALQRVVPDSLEFGFRLVAEGTPAATAVLEIVEVPARVRCRECGEESAVDGALLLCAACSSSQLEVLSGDEVLVDEVELADSPAEVIRRPGSRVEEPPHEHDHGHEHVHAHAHPTQAEPR